MTPVLSQSLTLEDFLELPELEQSPAWEYVAGHAVQKPMPKLRHSLLQKRLLTQLDGLNENYLTLPELRCTFGGRSIVPDVVMISFNAIQFNELGEPEDQFLTAPDWAIEILSPDQSSNRVIDNLLHCLKHGSKLGWLVDPNDYSVLILTAPQDVKICRGDQLLQVLPDLELQLTAQDIFNWLKLGKKE
ncbi:Uma2 family endonuclease [Spirulina major]|uniref:Uma2 family endonuclease n=1 Tax=Spirulina major TaxID=270636 RepID=UPI0009324E32|nr:Uma2 family endonuclease [Spirulina major]